MSDFINSLNVQTQDLVYTQKNGLIEGISTVFLNGLKQLDIFQRPIHCTDVKREILYIKENNTWEKEQSKDKIRNAINDVAYKQRDAIKKWEFNNPSWQQTDNGKDEYIDLVKTVMEDIDKNSYSENKIIKSIIKETIIDK
jgi:thymidylate synthase